MPLNVWLFTNNDTSTFLWWWFKCIMPRFWVEITHLATMFCRNPCICFPCTNKLDISPEAMEILTQIEGKKQKLLMIEEDIKILNIRHQKYLQNFKEKEKRYSNLMHTIKTEVFWIKTSGRQKLIRILAPGRLSWLTCFVFYAFVHWIWSFG